MTMLWILAAFSFGGILGFGLFAALDISRESRLDSTPRAQQAS